MTRKPYKISEPTPMTVNEPVVAYQRTGAPSYNKINPIVPFQATQEEWWEHIHSIEEGEFMTPEEFKNRHNAWKKDFLASHMADEPAPMTLDEPAVAYRTNVQFSDKINPIVPFHVTQEEFLEHIHRIEEGEFMTIEEADKEFEIWKKDFLASLI
jgi:hypothetical protein